MWRTVNSTFRLFFKVMIGFMPKRINSSCIENIILICIFLYTPSKTINYKCHVSFDIISHNTIQVYLRKL